MSNFAYARFEERAGQLFRYDTRIYLSDDLEQFEAGGKCVGAVVGKNPGSARPKLTDGRWARLDLAGDKMLPSVRNRFVEAYRRAQKPIPADAYVQVWNLFYLVNNNDDQACSALRSLPNLVVCPSEAIKPKVVWFAWGRIPQPEHRELLNRLKGRFLLQGHEDVFFFGNANSGSYDLASAKIQNGLPSTSDFVKHSQGIPKSPVVDRLVQSFSRQR